MTPSFRRLTTFFSLASTFAAIVLLTGCQTTGPEGADFQSYNPPVATTSAQTESADGSNVLEGTTSTNGTVSRGYTDKFLVGDVVSVTFSGTSEQIPPHEERIKDDGTITLSLVGPIMAAGKSAGELQKELQKEYDKYYKTLVVTVASFQRFYYVGGEVKKPGAQPYLGETTVTKAIQAAGDFTDFAKKNSIKVIRNDGTSLTVNFGKAIDNPKLDPPIYPGDKIHVPRRIFW